jgi:hypothetical protein
MRRIALSTSVAGTLPETAGSPGYRRRSAASASAVRARIGEEEGGVGGRDVSSGPTWQRLWHPTPPLLTGISGSVVSYLRFRFSEGVIFYGFSQEYVVTVQKA